jgi:hypothetical protein
MGFKDVRKAVIEKLKTGQIQHELRNEISTKNLLSTGEKSPEDVIEMLKVCNGKQHKTFKHKDSSEVDVHEFKPILLGQQWYIKCYLIEPDVWFISVHN